MEIGVVIPNFNYGRYLGDCLGSFLALRVPAGVVFRALTLVDDGSTDNSIEVIESHRGAFEAKGIEFKLIEFLRNRGVSEALNKGISTTSTEWIFPFGSDNMILPFAFSDVYSCAYENLKRIADVVPLGWRGFGKNHDGTPYRRTRIYKVQNNLKAVKQGRNIASGCSPYIRETWEQYPYREDLRKGEDGDRWKRLVEMGYRFNPTSRSCALVRGHRYRLSAQTDPVETAEIRMRKKV